MFKQLILAIFGLIIVTVFLSWYLQPSDFSTCTEAPSGDAQCGTADAIVVISGGETASRTAAGIDLYRNGWAPYLVLSGAAQDKSGPSNAAAMRDQALAAGVPDSAILLDEKAETTRQNAQQVQSIFSELGFEEVILVTSGYHQRRASLEFNASAPDVTIRNHPIQDGDWSWYWWVTPRGWWLASSETVKIVIFYLGAIF